MSHLRVDIERIVLDGVSFDPAKGNRLAALTQMALERLLRERGVSARLRAGERTQEQATANRAADMKSTPTTEARWADELAEILFRTIDRSL
jgi:hypothetical protein